MRAVKYSPIAKETNPDAGTFAFGNLSPQFSEESKNNRPLNISWDRMRKD